MLLWEVLVLTQLYAAQKNLWVLFWVGFFQSRNESTFEEVSVNELEEPLNIFSAGRYDNYNVDYSKKSAKTL